MSTGANFLLSGLKSLTGAVGFEAQFGVSGVSHLVGHTFPNDVIEATAVVAAETDLVETGKAVRTLVKETGDPDSWEGAAAQIALLMPAIKSVNDKLGSVSGALRDAVNATGLLSADEKTTINEALDDTKKAFFENAIAEALAGDARPAFLALYVLGAIVRERKEVVGEGYYLDVTRLNFDTLKSLFTDPLSVLAAPFAWGSQDFDPSPLFMLVASTSDPRLPAPLGTTEEGEPLLKAGLVDISRHIGRGDLGLKLNYNSIIGLHTSGVGNLGGGWVLERTGSLDLEGEVDLIITPPLQIEIDASAQLEGSLDFTLKRDSKTGRHSLFGNPVADPVAAWIEEPSASLGLEAKASSDGTVSIGHVLSASAKGLSLKVSAADNDGFLKSVLGAIELAPVVDLDASWSAHDGLKLKASGGMEVSIPINKELGPVNFNELEIALLLESDDAILKLNAGLSLGVKIGPVAATVERIGVSLKVVSEDAKDALPIGLRADFLPPRGLGLAIEAGPAKGGGFLSFDHEKGRYGGALEIDIGTIGVAAVGLLTTKGEEGFSLVLLMSGEFPAIQLGFGFTLNALGGLVGINRTSDVDFLREGLRNKTLDNVMFPKDPVARAPAIVRDLDGVFPAKKGQHIFGPMVRMGWGTPTLLAAELGLILELDSPLRLILMGKLRAGLPSLDIDPQIAKINMDVLGIIDFDRKEASLDAVLYDSRIALHTLEGEMAMRLRWGAQPYFILAIGGVHPAFERPPELPDLKRIAISLGAGDNPRLRLEAFVAVSSNTVQFGAALDARAAAMGFSAKARLGFDALFELSPFSFQAHLFASAALKRGSTTLMSVNLDLKLIGPTPYVVTGKVTAEIFFVPVSVPFNAQFGEEKSVPLPLGDPFAKLAEALTDPGNWSADLPDAGAPHVRLTGSGTGAVHPLGRLGVRQQVLPLDLTLDKFGALGVGIDRHFHISAIKAALGEESKPLEAEGATRLKEPFAPAQFVEMDNDEKLAAPSFEQMTAGLSGFGNKSFSVPFIGSTPGTRTSLVRETGRKTLYIFNEEDGAEDAAAPAEEQLLMASVAPPPRRASALGALALAEKRYVLAAKRGLTRLRAQRNGAFAGIPELSAPDAHLYSAAKRALAAHLERHPGDRGRIVIVAEHELEVAA
ncbi:MAG: DUF6603 domain-containing protein [Pseudomonadota bacterium]